MYFRYRLSPFGRMVIIFLLIMLATYIIQTMIEEAYLKEIAEECQKNGSFKTKQIDMSCSIIYSKF